MSKDDYLGYCKIAIAGTECQPWSAINTQGLLMAMATFSSVVWVFSLLAWLPCAVVHECKPQFNPAWMERFHETFAEQLEVAVETDVIVASLCLSISDSSSASLGPTDDTDSSTAPGADIAVHGPYDERHHRIGVCKRLCPHCGF